MFVLFTYSSAVAESYVGFGLGVALSHDVTDISGKTTAGVEGTLTDLDPENGFSYGVKLGHYFENTPWLGVEFDFYQRAPDIDQQTATATGTAGIYGATVGQIKVDVDSSTTFGFLVMLRANEEQSKNLFNLEPSLGVGFGVNTIDLADASTFTTAGAAVGSTNLGSDTQIGFLISAGLKYKINDKIKAYGEYKFTESSFEVTGADTNTYKFDVGDSNLMFGLSYSF